MLQSGSVPRFELHLAMPSAKAKGTLGTRHESQDTSLRHIQV